MFIFEVTASLFKSQGFGEMCWGIRGFWVSSNLLGLRLDPPYFKEGNTQPVMIII
jgi:hypothetical protein